MQLETRVDHHGALVVLALGGEVDLATLPRLRDALVRLIDAHPATTIALDLDAVDVMDDSGFGVVLGAAARARDHDGELVLVCSGVRMLERLRTIRLDRAMTVYPTVTAAAVRS